MHTFPGINWFSPDVSQRSRRVGVDGLVLQQVSPESIPDKIQKLQWKYFTVLLTSFFNSEYIHNAIKCPNFSSIKKKFKLL